MQISIDTQRDSPEELRKLIRLLSALVGDSTAEPINNIPPATDGNVMAAMFGDDPIMPSAPTAQMPTEEQKEESSEELEYY